MLSVESTLISTDVKKSLPSMQPLDLPLLRATGNYLVL